MTLLALFMLFMTNFILSEAHHVLILYEENQVLVIIFTIIFCFRSLFCCHAFISPVSLTDARVSAHVS